ncbi:hypothetical protein [Aliiglaciecola sp. M165]|uniref:hypothetical protein n=1 Tax=Aliiglaciecola sp. M165 TaxID=2593649 RepID=UPI00117BFEF1|nr:hypothetical protein [Aliiglaciecola sp. M165]TRY28674.1 hypothetical protein FM019_20655 [Aliiglaciecola sp. M165]
MEKVNVELSKDEALVLFEFLTRQSESEDLRAEHNSEKIVLSSVVAQLEKSLSEPFSSNWSAILDLSRKRINETWS